MNFFKFVKHTLTINKFFLKKYFLFFFIFINVFVLKTNAQIDTAFWFVAPEVWQGHDDRPIYLRFASFENPATITISQPANALFPTQTLNLNANDAQSIDLTTWIDMIENKPVNLVLDYGIYISSTTPVTAYYEEASVDNPDLFSLKGNNALGTEFYTPFQDLVNSYYSESKAGIDIVATQDSTVIQITPTNSLIGHPANTEFTINLNKGQTYSLRSASTLSYLRPSGTYISSNKPISVIVSDDSILGSSYYGGLAFDLLGDQIIPVNKMGQEYIAIKGQLNADDKIYITASEDNTDIYSGTTLVDNIDAGETYELGLSSSSIYFSSSKPVIALHMTGYGSEVCGAILPPINCTGSQDVSFIRSEDNPYFKLNLLVKSGGEGNFSFNGNTNFITSADFSDVPNTSGEWKFASISDPTYVQILQNSNITNSSDYFHVGIIMGRFSSSRYGYFSNFNTFEHEITTSTESYCDGESIVLSAELLPNVDYIWEGPNGFSASGNNFDFGSVSLIDSGAYILSGDIGECEVRSDTLNLYIIAKDDPSFTVSNFCQDSTNAAIVTGLENGTFTLLNSTDGAIINPVNGELSNTSIGSSYQVMYQTNGACPDSLTQFVDVLANENASFTVNDFCFGESNSAEISGVLGGYFSLIINPDGAIIDSTSGTISNGTAESIYTIQYNTLGSLTSCPNSSQEIVEVFPIPDSPNTTSSYNYCFGETTQAITVLPSELNSSIQWFSDSNLTTFLAESDTYEINPILGTTTVFVTETSINNCQSTPTLISQNIFPLPTIFAGDDIELCYGENLTLNGDGGISYLWNNGVQNNVPFVPEVGLNEYIVTANNNYNCFDSDTIEVLIYPNPTPNAGFDENVCGLEYQLQAIDNGNLGYWSANDANISSPNLQSTDVLNNFFGLNTFVWHETNTFGCESSSSVSINFFEEPNVNILEDTTYGCENEIIEVEGYSSNAISYLWSTDGSGSFQNANQSVSEYIYSNEDLENSEVTLFLRSQLGDCFSSDTSLLVLNKTPKAIISSDEFLCYLDSSISLDISSSGNNPVSYDLYLNNQLHTSFSNLSYGEDSVLISGLGLYQITNLKDAFCEGENSEEYNLILKERPLAEFSLYPRETSISEPIVYVNDQSLFANYYEWSFGDSSNVSFAMDTYHEYQEAGTFDIILYVENEFGCKDSAISKVIIYPEFELYIPNAFTPDGDDINDSFLCKGYGIDRYSISILNRWGQLVFSSNDINKAWDGKNAINGVYVYRIEIIDLIGKLHFFEGEISMLR